MTVRHMRRPKKNYIFTFVNTSIIIITETVLVVIVLTCNRIISSKRSPPGGDAMEHTRHQILWRKCRMSHWQHLSNIQFIFTFGFVRSSEGVVRALVNMDYVASDELGNLVRLGIVLEMYFTYAVQ